MKKVQTAVEAKRSTAREILSVLPGYHGYSERETQRKTDNLIREIVSDRMGEARRYISGAYRIAVGKPEMSEGARQLERVLMKCDTLGQRILHAEAGYSPFMSIIKVNQRTLNELMEFDASLIEQIDDFKSRAELLLSNLTSGSFKNEEIIYLDAKVDEIERIFNKRKIVLMGV